MPNVFGHMPWSWWPSSRRCAGHVRRLDHAAPAGQPQRTNRICAYDRSRWLGVVESLSRPGGNSTGFTQFEYSIPAKWLELLKEIAPATMRAAVLRDPFDPAGVGQWAAMQSVASVFAVELRGVNVRDKDAIESGWHWLTR